jgi:hypothetical protein
MLRMSVLCLLRYEAWPRHPAPAGSTRKRAPFFWDSESTGIFIDQAALNGTRPNSPEGVKPATAPSLRVLLSIQKHPERHSAQFSRDAEPATRTLKAQKGARLVGPAGQAQAAPCHGAAAAPKNTRP